MELHIELWNKASMQCERERERKRNSKYIQHNDCYLRSHSTVHFSVVIQMCERYLTV